MAPLRLIYGVEQAAWIHPKRGLSPTGASPTHLTSRGVTCQYAMTYNIVGPPLQPVIGKGPWPMTCVFCHRLSSAILPANVFVTKSCKKVFSVKGCVLGYLPRLRGRPDSRERNETSRQTSVPAVAVSMLASQPRAYTTEVST